jgi:Uma2 family endonuclease
MPHPVSRLASYEDLISLPESVTGEIIGGVLYTQPRPAGPHTAVASALGADLGSAFGRGRGGPGGWYILYEPELHLDGDVVVPDLAGWRVERLPADARKQPFFTTAPDWVAEIASPASTQRDRLIKVPLYAARGVAHLWLIEPVDARVEAYKLVETRWSWLGTWAEEREARIPPFDAIPLDLIAIWEWTGLRG